MEPIFPGHESNSPGGDSPLPCRLLSGLAQLLDAWLYARDTNRARWDFAVSSATLRAAGMGWNDLRWLTCKGYVEHAREITRGGDTGRRFQPEGELVLHKRSHFVLTDGGADYVRSIERAVGRTDAPQESIEGGGEPAGRIRTPPEGPHWDVQLRELRLNGRLVKRFLTPSPNQERILAVFQEEGWPPRIDDPLPPHPELDPKRRLRDTVKSLNHHQINPLLRLACDGTGQGVRWRATVCSQKCSS